MTALSEGRGGLAACRVSADGLGERGCGRRVARADLAAHMRGGLFQLNFPDIDARA